MDKFVGIFRDFIAALGHMAVGDSLVWEHDEVDPLQILVDRMCSLESAGDRCFSMHAVDGLVIIKCMEPKHER